MTFLEALNAPTTIPATQVQFEDLISKPLHLANPKDIGPTYGLGDRKNKAPQLENGHGNMYACVKCPVCNEARDMHQRAYEVYARKKEDGPATRVSINNADCQATGEFVLNSEETAEAPSRRDSIAIQFICSECNSLPVLHIRQHKGSTLMWFTVTEELAVIDYGEEEILAAEREVRNGGYEESED